MTTENLTSCSPYVIQLTDKNVDEDTAGTASYSMPPETPFIHAMDTLPIPPAALSSDAVWRGRVLRESTILDARPTSSADSLMIVTVTECPWAIMTTWVCHEG